MKKVNTPISIMILSTMLIAACGGQKDETTSNEKGGVKEVVATSTETSEVKEGSENEESTTEKIEEKAKEAKEKVVEKINEGKEASKPVLNRIKGKLKEKIEQKESN